MVSALMKTLGGMNRSGPHMQLTKNILNILANLAYFKPLRPHIISQFPEILVVISNQLATHRDAPEQLLPAATLFDRLIADQRNAPSKLKFKEAEKGYAMKKMQMTLDHLKRKSATAQSAEQKAKKIPEVHQELKRSVALMNQILSALNSK